MLRFSHRSNHVTNSAIARAQGTAFCLELPYALKVSLASPRPSPTLHRPVQMVENIDVEVVNVKAASKKASEGKHVISLSDLDPDVDGDGVVSQYEKEVHKLFLDADADGSGTLNVKEFYDVLRKVTEMGKAKHQLKKMLTLAVFLIILLVGANTALTVAVTIAFKDSYTPASGVTTTKSGGLIRPGAYAMKGDAKAVRSRRLVEHHGRTLISVADLDAAQCEQVKTAALASGQTAGSAQVQTTGGATNMFSGSVTQMTTESGTSVFKVSDATNNAEVHNCGTVFVAVSRVRKLAVEEAHASRRRLASDMHDELKPVSKGCAVFHCFEGDEACSNPSPPNACAEWDTEKKHCIEPLCQYVVD